MPDVVLYQGTGEWSALYVDGKMEVCGDHYLSDERIQSIFGVTVVQSDDFLMGTDRAPAQTLDELRAWQTERDLRVARAARLREEAAGLLAEAATLEGPEST